MLRAPVLEHRAQTLADTVAVQDAATAQPVAPDAAPSHGFRSAWGTALGAEPAAVTDGGAWDEASYCGRSDVLSVVPGATVDFPDPHVFCVTMRGDNGCGYIQRRGAVPRGVTHWGRMYVRNDETQMGGSVHNFAYHFLGDIQLIFFNRRAVPGGWVLEIAGLPVAFPFTVWTLQSWLGTDVFNPPRIVLQHRVWYRYEWELEFLDGATRYRFWPRVYGPDGRPLYDAADFYQMSTPVQGTATLATWYAAGNAFPVRDLDRMTNIGLGNEGRVPSPNSGESWYVGRFAVSTDGWIGEAA